METDNIKKQGWGIIVMLILQYTLGMAANLFVIFPTNSSAGQNWLFAWTHILVAMHIILGILLLVNAIIMVFRSGKFKIWGWLNISIIGLIAIIMAIYGGAAYVTTQKDIYSFIMALGFIVAFITYGWGEFFNR